MLALLCKRPHAEVVRGVRAPVLPEGARQSTLSLAKRQPHISDYHTHMGWPAQYADYLHPAYLAMYALTFQTPLLLQKSQPFAVLGLVHMSNNMHYSRLANVTETLTINCQFGKLWAHKRGWVFAVITTAKDASGEVIFTLASHYLYRCAKRCADHGYPDYTPYKISMPVDVSAEQTQWSLASNLGRCYARLSGDYNPIHLYSWTARWFGFKRPIVHGMWSKARALSQLAHTWQPAQLSGPMTTHVQFMNFIALPNQIAVHYTTDPQQLHTVCVGLPLGVTPTEPHRPYFLLEHCVDEAP